MRKTVLATAVAAALSLSAANASAQTKGAATKAEVEAVQAQLQTLVDRMNKLEATNATLTSENAELKALADRREAEMDYLKQQTKDLRADGANAANDLSKVKGADWATKIKFKGDLRFRDENIQQERTVADATGTAAAVEDAADRNRPRLRARFGLEAAVTDTVKVTLGLASGSDNDPRSTNQTLGGENTKKSIWLDQMFVDWRFAQGADLLLGKMKYPFWRPGQSLFFDNDVNPEGIAFTFDRGMLFGSAYGWMLEERFGASPTAQNTDTHMVGAQLGLKFPLFGGETRIAAHYYDLLSGQGSNPFWVDASGNAQPYGNSVVTAEAPNPLATKSVLLYDYNVAMLSAEIGATLGSLPLSIWADYAQNMASDVDEDTAYAFGVVLGKASNPKTWEIGLMYESLDKDALFAQFIDSDFADGTTNADGWVLKAAWAPARNVTLNGTYFMNTRTVCGAGTSPGVNVLCGPGIPEYDLDYQRLQLDVNYKF